MYEDGKVYSKCQTNIVFFIYYLVLYIIVPTYERNIKKNIFNMYYYNCFMYHICKYKGGSLFFPWRISLSD